MIETQEEIVRKEAICEVYHRNASGYLKPPCRFYELIANRLTQLAAPEPGDRILDLATGPGSAAIHAARATGETGEVFGIDKAQNMIESARRRAAIAGLRNARFQVADASAPDFFPDTLDTILCSSALYYFSHPEQMLQEALRMLKPGGRFGFAVFGPGVFGKMATLLANRLDCFEEELSPALAFPSDCRRVLEMVKAAGFDVCSVREDRHGYYLRNAEDWWDVVTHTSLGLSLTSMDSEEVLELKTEHLAEVARLSTPQGIWLDVPAIYGLWQR